MLLWDEKTPSQLNKVLVFVNTIIFFSIYLYLIAMLKVKKFLLLIILISFMKYTY